MAAGTKAKRPTPLQLCLGNVGEFYEPHLKALDERARHRWRSSALQVGGAALLWNIATHASDVASTATAGSAVSSAANSAVNSVQPGRVVVLPAGVDEGLILELDGRLGLGGVEVVTPSAVSGLLCFDLLRDPRALARITELARANGGQVEVAAWGETEGLCQLIEELARRGLEVQSPYGRHGNLIRVAQLDSKAGLRGLVRGALARGALGEMGEFSGQWCDLLPEGEVAGGLGEAAAIAQRMASSGAVVVKAALSTCGVGQVRIDRGRYSVKELARRLEFAARATPELAAWPLVVERYHSPPVVESGSGSGQGGGYSAQCVADGVGGARVLFIAVHAGLNAGMGRGLCAAIGTPAVGLKRAGEIETLAEELGRDLSAWGYSGIFGLDLVVDEGGGLKLVEVNARRTTLSAGGELLRLAALRRGGKEGVVLFYERLPDMAGCLSWQEQKGHLSELLFPIDGRAEGWVPLPLPLPSEVVGPDDANTVSGFAVASTLPRALEVATAVCRALSTAFERGEGGQ